MKITKLSVLALLFILMSCSQTEEMEQASSTVVAAHSISDYQHRATDVAPDNSANPYDVAGLLNSELSLAYYSIPLRDTFQSAIISEVVGLANSNVRFQQLSPDAYVFSDTQTLHQLLSDTDASSILIESIQFAILDVDLQITLENFIHYIVDNYANEVGYESLYTEIVSFENGIQHNAVITEGDRMVVLTTTSILRYNLSARRKRPKKNTDRDWDYMITTLGATAVGAKNDIQNAIILSLITEISLEN